jgi:hypothetical protein
MKYCMEEAEHFIHRWYGTPDEIRENHETEREQREIKRMKMVAFGRILDHLLKVYAQPVEVGDGK